MATLDNLRHFTAVVENKGVLKAAEKVYISASSITRSIQLVESRVGFPLFDRVGRTLQLNREGRRFYDRAKAVLGQYEALFHEKDLKTSKLTGHYRLGASHFLSEHILSSIAAEFVRKYPAASFEVFSLDSHILMKKLHSGEIDMGIVFSPKPSDTLESLDIHSRLLRVMRPALLCACQQADLQRHSHQHWVMRR